MRRIAALLLALLALPAMAEQFDLVCTWSVGNLTPVDSTFRIDTSSYTVNGRRALISDAEIRFDLTDDQGTTATIINRYTGSMSISVRTSQGYDVSGHGRCVKPTQRQF